jgi:hypothetical protein
VTESKKPYRAGRQSPIRTIDGQPVTTIKHALEYAGARPEVSASATVKKNYAERFSRAVATCIANRLRGDFRGVTPDEEGRHQEMPARTAKGFKKLDVNFSTPELGLALGVSVKSINFPDWSTAKKRVGRFTKNYSRNDNELRAEAMDYHQRQPYAALVGVLFLPEASYHDAGKAGKGEEQGVSSFGAAVKFFRSRAGRRTAKNEIDLFEQFFIGVYNEDTGETCFFDVTSPPPRNRALRADECLSFEQFIQEIIRTYNTRNNPPFQWAE